ncbi:Vps54-like domain containing protein [Lactarius tabidus]
MCSAGLKNVTTKHLALASQSLSIVITLIPYVCKMFWWHLSPKQAVMLIEFDKLKCDYQEHQNDLHSIQWLKWLVVATRKRPEYVWT